MTEAEAGDSDFVRTDLAIELPLGLESAVLALGLILLEQTN
jgi:hypothetical protein